MSNKTLLSEDEPTVNKITVENVRTGESYPVFIAGPETKKVLETLSQAFDVNYADHTVPAEKPKRQYKKRKLAETKEAVAA